MCCCQARGQGIGRKDLLRELNEEFAEGQQTISDEI